MSEAVSTTRIVGVKFRSVGKVYDFDAGEHRFNRGDQVVCDFDEKGPLLGFVSKPTLTVEAPFKLKLRPILRPASGDDLDQRAKHEIQEKESLRHVKQLVQDHKLAMHIIAIEIPLTGKKTIVYFSAPDRVDFRELLKDLVTHFKTRVELRQLGARDETKFIGGIGPCGQETCCSRFIGDFHSVNIKMAKDQGLALNPTKVTGNCGRLKCCLAYEQPVYVEARKTLPKLGNCVKCTQSNGGVGCGVVVKLEILKQNVLVKFDDGVIEMVPANRILEVDTLQGKSPEDGKVYKDSDYLQEEDISTLSQDESDE